MRKYNYYRKLKQSRQLPVYQRTIKDGDIVIQKVPLNEFGNPTIPYDVIYAYHKTLKDKLPKNIVVTTVMEIEVISKVDVELKSEF